MLMLFSVLFCCFVPLRVLDKKRKEKKLKNNFCIWHFLSGRENRLGSSGESGLSSALLSA